MTGLIQYSNLISDWSPPFQSSFFSLPPFPFFVASSNISFHIKMKFPCNYSTFNHDNIPTLNHPDIRIGDVIEADTPLSSMGPTMECPGQGLECVMHTTRSICTKTLLGLRFCANVIFVFT